MPQVHRSAGSPDIAVAGTIPTNSLAVKPVRMDYTLMAPATRCDFLDQSPDLTVELQKRSRSRAGGIVLVLVLVLVFETTASSTRRTRTRTRTIS
jgi:hypothetical protein